MTVLFVQDGNSIDYTPSADVAGGSVLVINDRVLVAKLDIPANVQGCLYRHGIWDVPAVGGVIADGAAVYWDEDGDPYGGVAGSGAFTTNPAGGANKFFGYAVGGKGATDARLIVEGVNVLGTNTTVHETLSNPIVDSGDRAEPGRRPGHRQADRRGRRGGGRPNRPGPWGQATCPGVCDRRRGRLGPEYSTRPADGRAAGVVVPDGPDRCRAGHHCDQLLVRGRYGRQAGRLAQWRLGQSGGRRPGGLRWHPRRPGRGRPDAGRQDSVGRAETPVAQGCKRTQRGLAWVPVLVERNRLRNLVHRHRRLGQDQKRLGLRDRLPKEDVGEF
ncbi:MAG: DUF2190 family protein [Pirellulales bacterium]|nr:DUF2190 family protein [Pirellulales bacterium]